MNWKDGRLGRQFTCIPAQNEQKLVKRDGLRFEKHHPFFILFSENRIIKDGNTIEGRASQTW